MKKTLLRSTAILLALIGTLVYADKPDLVEVQKVNPNIRTEIRYATFDNCIKTKLYSSAKCYLLREVAEALSQAQQELEKQGLGLKIWDGYRPAQVQERVYNELLREEQKKYWANPKEGGSNHSRGITVDLTLVHANGAELEMPTIFDDLSEKASPAYADLPAHVIANRQLLFDVMRKHGFDGSKIEWWHHNYTKGRSYPLLYVTLEELEQQN